MTYTLWSLGRLLGTTDLDWVRVLPRQRTGDLHPTPLGEALLPVACGVGPALRSHGHDVEHPAVRDAIARSEALRLELHSPDGEIIPTEDLWVQDAVYLLSLANERPLSDAEEPEELEIFELDAHDAELEAMLAELPEFAEERREHDEREWPRYQLFVTLVDEASIP